MTRFVIDAQTLLHLVDGNLPVDAGHQLVAPNSIRSEALQLRLLGDRVSRGVAWRIAREHDWDSAANVVPVASVQAMLAADDGG